MNERGLVELVKDEMFGGDERKIRKFSGIRSFIRGKSSNHGHEVHDSEGNDDDAENRRGDHNDDQGGDHLQQALQEELHVVRQLQVDCLDVLEQNKNKLN